MHCPCPLCNFENNTANLVSQDGRTFGKCDQCSLIYCDPSAHPTITHEQERYNNHQNTPENPGYRTFLSRAIDPVLEILRTDNHLSNDINKGSENAGNGGLHALDFGCGPGPVLSLILGENGIPCFNYDPIYFPNWPESTFNLIFSTETFEHFHQPGETISQITDLLQPGGILCVMTEQWTDVSRFSSWYYTRDDTHVCFYHTDTFQWICEKFGYKILSNDRKRVIILQKRPIS